MQFAVLCPAVLPATVTKNQRAGLVSSAENKI